MFNGALRLLTLSFFCSIVNFIKRKVAQLGRTLALGAKVRRFYSCLSDQQKEVIFMKPIEKI